MFKHLILGMFCFGALFGAEQGSKGQVVDKLQSLTKAVNQGNTQILPGFWTEDATFMNPHTGEVLRGKKEISPYLLLRVKEINTRKLNFNFTPGKIEFPDKDRAVVEGISEITNKGALLQRNARQIVLVRKNGDWLISSIKEIEVPPAPPLFENLKELDWLVGDWKDVDENVDISFKTKWDAFKNFLIQQFKMKIYGNLVMEGLQIIGWDPVEKKIRSWVYDSDGGVGTGLWTRKGDVWSVKMDYVLSDGTKGSATNIYTKQNNSKYQYSSIDRKIGEESIPSIEPVTVVREG